MNAKRKKPKLQDNHSASMKLVKSFLLLFVSILITLPISNAYAVKQSNQSYINASKVERYILDKLSEKKGELESQSTG